MFKYEKTKEEMEKKLRENEKFRLIGNKRKRPAIRISGVRKGYEWSELKRIIMEENDEIKNNFYKSWMDESKFLTKKECRHKGKENWIIEVEPDIFKFFMKKGQIYFDLTVLYVEQYLEIPICNNCCRYGHVGKHCKMPATCYKCGGSHEGRQCKSPEKIECTNCKRRGLRNDHQANNNNRCTAYQKRLKEEKKWIEYGEDRTQGRDRDQEESINNTQETETDGLNTSTKNEKAGSSQTPEA